MAAVEITNSHKGAVAEAVAAAWLLKQGYYVFLTQTITGPVDLVAWRPDEDPILVDVKGVERGSWKGKPTAFGCMTQPELSKARGIRHLYVNLSRDLISWDMEDFHRVAAQEDADRAITDEQMTFWGLHDAA
ncbi:MAG TPA: hypothetical protein QF469_22005 [Sphingomonas sanguinis]|uniref:hypothetical protein n=1 Tax=Sphingomonas sanguinis TaxID=33051 RepID=UPI002AC2AF91|nr:hypothetical protein [Sphingomonas sanguinis]